MILLKHIRECEGRADAEGGDRGSSLLFSKKDVREIEFTYIRQKQHTHKAFTGRFTLHLPPPPNTHCIPFREPGLPQGPLAGPLTSAKCCMPVWKTNQNAQTPVCIYLMYIDTFKIK